jgi:hypothetical protein
MAIHNTNGIIKTKITLDPPSRRRMLKAVSPNGFICIDKPAGEK